MDLASFVDAEYTKEMCSVTMPACIPCHICPSESTAEECKKFQCMYGCHGCDRQGCWHTSPSCVFYKRFREPHADALLADSTSHMRQTHITCIADGRVITGERNVNWWTGYNEVRFVVNHAEHVIMGTASGEEYNCLIDTLRQQLQQH